MRKRPNLKIEQKDKAPEEIEKRLPIKKATADNLECLNQEMQIAQRKLAIITQRMQDSMRSIFTEAGLEGEPIPVQVTTAEPYELVVKIKQ